MAKKRGGSRKSASSPVRRKTSGSKRRTPAKTRGTGKELDFRPLKRRLKSDVDRLSAVERPDARVKRALARLKRVQSEMKAICSPTMVIPLP